MVAQQPDTANTPAQAIDDLVVAMWQRAVQMIGTGTFNYEDGEFATLYTRLTDSLGDAGHSQDAIDMAITALTQRLGPAWDPMSIFGTPRSLLNHMRMAITQVGVIDPPLSEEEAALFAQALEAFRQRRASEHLSQLEAMRAARVGTCDVDFHERMRLMTSFIPRGVIF